VPLGAVQRANEISPFIKHARRDREDATGRTVAMLEVRPNCEYCDRDLPADSTEARICSYECTFCAACVETVLHDVCPNCGGGFVPRPIRPRIVWRPGAGLGHDPASTRRVHLKYPKEDVAALVASLKDIPPRER
jgi:hypothetical protein